MRGKRRNSARVGRMYSRLGSGSTHCGVRWKCTSLPARPASSETIWMPVEPEPIPPMRAPPRSGGGLGEDGDPGRAGADHADARAVEPHVVVPASRVERRAREALE